MKCFMQGLYRRESRDLNSWLHYIASIHQEMDFGLERVKAVASHLDLLHPNVPVITVAGTNGKGSTIRGLEKIYQAAGFKTGIFSTPFIYRHNEQVRIEGIDAHDDLFC